MSERMQGWSPSLKSVIREQTICVGVSRVADNMVRIEVIPPDSGRVSTDLKPDRLTPLATNVRQLDLRVGELVRRPTARDSESRNGTAPVRHR